MIVRSLGSTLRQLLTRNYVRLVTPVLRIYIRTFVSSRHKYSQGYIHVVKKDMQYITPVAFRYTKGSEFVQRLTAAAFDVISEYHSLQDWYTHQWECLYQAITQLIKSQCEQYLKKASNDINDDTSHEPVNLDSYVIEDKIGDISTCAAVYKALRGDTAVALKAMFNFSCSDPTEMLRFDNFGAELITFSTSLPPHPNVIQINTHFVSNNVPLSTSAGTEYPAVFEFGEEETLFIEMPLYTCSLKEYLSSHTLSEREVLWVVYQIVSAVHHIHSHDIVHRDIKLDNILVRQDSGALDAVLTDFGMSHTSLHTSHHPAGRKWGNPMLMPPEIALSPSPSSSLDYSAADIWCVGSLVYELCGADNPFSSRSSSTYSTLPPLPSLNLPLSLLTDNLLSRDPHHRLTPTECLATCGAMLWLPHLFHQGDVVTMETVARELTLVTWHLFKGVTGGDVVQVEILAFVEFVQVVTPQDIARVVRKFIL